METIGLLRRLVAAGTATVPAQQGLPELISDLAPEMESMTELLLADRERDQSR